MLVHLLRCDLVGVNRTPPHIIWVSSEYFILLKEGKGTYSASQAFVPSGVSPLMEQSMGLTVAEALRSVMTECQWAATSAEEQEDGTQTASVRSSGSA